MKLKILHLDPLSIELMDSNQRIKTYESRGKGYVKKINHNGFSILLADSISKVSDEQVRPDFLIEKKCSESFIMKTNPKVLISVEEPTIKKELLSENTIRQYHAKVNSQFKLAHMILDQMFDGGIGIFEDNPLVEWTWGLQKKLYVSKTGLPTELMGVPLFLCDTNKCYGLIKLSPDLNNLSLSELLEQKTKHFLTKEWIHKFYADTTEFNLYNVEFVERFKDPQLVKLDGLNNKNGVIEKVDFVNKEYTKPMVTFTLTGLDDVVGDSKIIPMLFFTQDSDENKVICQLHFDGKDVKIYTSDGEDITTNCSKIIQDFVEKQPRIPAVVTGEMDVLDALHRQPKDVTLGLLHRVSDSGNVLSTDDGNVLRFTVTNVVYFNNKDLSKVPIEEKRDIIKQFQNVDLKGSDDDDPPFFGAIKEVISSLQDISVDVPADLVTDIMFKIEEELKVGPYDGGWAVFRITGPDAGKPFHVYKGPDAEEKARKLERIIEYFKHLRKKNQ